MRWTSLFFGRRRTSGAGGVAFLAVAGVVAGWSSYRGSRFQDGCAAIEAGTPVEDAEAELSRLGGRRVPLANPRPGQVEYRFRSMVGSDHLCELQVDEGTVASTKGWRSRSLTR